MKNGILSFLSERALFKHTAPLLLDSEEFKAFPTENLIPVTDEAEATLVSSAVDGDDPWEGEQPLHLPALDLDFPAHLEPSSTPGHFHLYLNKEVEWDKYLKFLWAGHEAGILERGFVKAAELRKATFVRYPGVIKGIDERCESTGYSVRQEMTRATGRQLTEILKTQAEKTGLDTVAAAAMLEAAERFAAHDKIDNPGYLKLWP
jgi:hypothetical protein